MSSDLDLLVARLRWPVAATRWWAMQELAELLVAPGTSYGVSARLKEELLKCRLEAETLELLFVFWMAVQKGWTAPTDLNQVTQHKLSLLDELLSSMGLGSATVSCSPLSLAPSDFAGAKTLHQLAGSSIPRAYLTQARQLEAMSGCPALWQLEFEWLETEKAYPRAPYPGNLDYFVRPAGDGATGEFASRETLRVHSAYLRTLEVAKVHWGMPTEMARAYASKVVPVEPTLAALRPQKPAWLPAQALGESWGPERVSTFLSAIDENIARDGEGNSLLAIAFPLEVDNEEIIELTAIRFNRWGGSPIDEAALWHRFGERFEALSYCKLHSELWKTTSHLSSPLLSQVLDVETQSVPIAAVPAPSHVGYLHRELQLHRLFVPVLPEVEEPICVKPDGTGLSVEVGKIRVATSCYWNAAWGPAHPKEIDGLFGSALVGDARFSEKTATEAPSEAFLLWRLRRLTRDARYRAYDIGEEHGVLSVTKSH